MNNLAIIPARAGSKRIPNKNIKDFFGKPIIYYPIYEALSSNIFSEVMVSTDSSKIAKLSEKSGAKIPFIRSQKNSDDHAILPDVIEEVLSEYKKLGKYFDNICCIMPTNPFITSYILTDSFKKFKEGNGESMIAVKKISTPIEKTYELKNNMLFPLFKDHFKTRTQDLKPKYSDAGSFFWVTMEAFNEYKRGITDQTIPYILDESQVQDIDNLDDWKLAELKYKILNYE